jgi:hypothetical protein
MTEIKEWSKFFPKVLNLFPATRLHKSLKHSQSFQSRLKISFAISGDLQGTIDCYFSLENNDVSYDEVQRLFGVISESMNILTGHFLSLIQDGKIHITLSVPKIKFQEEQLIKQSEDQNYVLYHGENKFPCLIRPSLTWVH